MKLYTHCSGCGEEIKIKSSATDRRKLQMKYGDEMQVNCQHCEKLEKKPLHKIRAEVNSFHLFIAFGASTLLSIVIWLAFGLIGTVLFIIPFVFWLQQMNAARSFNSYSIRRH